MKRITAILLVTVFFSAPASALQPLHKNPTVLSGFYAIGLADEVRKNCDSISPRIFRAYMFLMSLKNYARDAGYTDDEIDALQHNKDAKEDLKQRIKADLAARGASPESPEGYCTVGREEIAKDSTAGRLLRAQ